MQSMVEYLGQTDKNAMGRITVTSCHYYTRCVEGQVQRRQSSSYEMIFDVCYKTIYIFKTPLRHFQLPLSGEGNKAGVGGGSELALF